MDISRKGYLEEHLNKLRENGLIKYEKDFWKLKKSKNLDEEIIVLLKRRDRLNTLQIISKLEQFSPNTLRPHLNNLAELGVIKKWQISN